jgi:hypothetical protein
LDCKEKRGFDRSSSKEIAAFGFMDQDEMFFWAAKREFMSSSDLAGTDRFDPDPRGVALFDRPGKCQSAAAGGVFFVRVMGFDDLDRRGAVKTAGEFLGCPAHEGHPQTEVSAVEDRD